MGTKLKALLNRISSTLSGFWTKVNSDVADLWQKDKAFVVLFGAVILVIQFRQLLVNLIVSGSKALFNQTQTTSQAEQSKENADNTSAENLIQQAESLTNSNPPVTDDWNKNEK